MHVAWSIALALCTIGMVCADAEQSNKRAVAAVHWQQIMSEYSAVFAAMNPSASVLHNARPQGGETGLPLLVLRVPMPVPVAAPAPTGPAAGCTRTAPAGTANILSVDSKLQYDTKLDDRKPILNSLGTKEHSGTAFVEESILPISLNSFARSAPATETPGPLRNAPLFYPVDDSRVLVEQFRAQIPTNPELPPVGIQLKINENEDDDEDDELATVKSLKRQRRGLRFDSAEEVWRGAAGPRARARKLLAIKRKRRDGSPAPRAPPLLFDQSLKLRARLTVPRADYTEPYTVWWDSSSGASRVEFHGGTATAYRNWRPDGLLQSVLVRVDRTGEAAVQRCAMVPLRNATLQERALPALPNVQEFSFEGYLTHNSDQLEIWRYKLAGRSGELGAVRGEALTFHHELLVSRAADNYTAVPVRYSVRVDSSVLGDNCDGYVHTYTQVTPAVHDPVTLQLDIAEACETEQITERLELVEPLREFTMLHRDPRYDDAFERFKEKYGRKYMDDREDAVRKNLLIQSNRFTASANRQGATFQLGTNFLSDRLVMERRMLLGATEAGTSGLKALRFPHSKVELNALRNRLPRNFDWRQRGAVTSVRNQWLCSSCWAFSVVGAVEGALAIKTGHLVELSEQSLLDCAQPYGGHGCNGSWPSSAYNYVQERGLPPLAQYRYEAKERECDAIYTPSVTRISGHVNVTRDNIVALKVAIKRHGPTVVILDGEQQSFTSYKRGYYSDTHCRRNSLNHALLAVGWTVYNRETYFILKNSWTTGWGDRGYILMRGADNTCGVLRRASYPLLRDADVQHIPEQARTRTDRADRTDRTDRAERAP